MIDLPNRGMRAPQQAVTVVSNAHRSVIAHYLTHAPCAVPHQSCEAAGAEVAASQESGDGGRARQECHVARLNHLVGNRIEPTVNLGELQRTQVTGASGSDEFDSRKPEKQIGQWSSSSARRDGCCVTAWRVGRAGPALTTSERLNPEKARSCLWTCANDSASCSNSATSARQAPHRRANARANIAFAPANEPSPFQGLEPRANPIGRMRAMAAASAITPAMDEQNVAIEGLRTPRHADVSFRRAGVSSPLPLPSGPARTASAGGKMLSYIARASRMSRTRSSSDFETNPTISPIHIPSGTAGFKALPQQVLWQVTPDENKPRLPRLLLLPGTPASSLDEHVHALNDELPIVILDRCDALHAQDVRTKALGDILNP